MLENMCLDDIPKRAIDLEEIYWSTYIKNIKQDDRLITVFKDIRKKSIKVGIVTDLTAHIQMRKLIKLGSLLILMLLLQVKSQVKISLILYAFH